MRVRARFAAAGSFLVRVLRKSRQDELGLRTSALAFSTLLALVPLLAGISVFLARTIRTDDQRILALAAELLPYREESILAALESFLEQTESVSGIAILGFVFTALVNFFAVQATLFRIFRVERAPSLWRRMVTFSMLFFWGPLLVGSAQAGYLLLTQTRPDLAEPLKETTILHAVPILLTFFGIAMLYWRASLQRVRFREAAFGSLVATIGLELLTEVFQVYVAQFTAVQRAVYGTFAILLFFVLSIQLAWWILLFGAEIAEALSEKRRGAPHELFRRDPDPWIGIGALELLAAPGRPTMPDHDLATRLALDVPTLIEQLRPLHEAGLVETGAGYRIAVPPGQLRIATVLAAYRRAMTTGAEAPLPERTAELRLRLRHALEHDAGAETIEQLVRERTETRPMERSGAFSAPAGPLDRPEAEEPATTFAQSPPELDRPEDDG